jgi:hypothetical protein
VPAEEAIRVSSGIWADRDEVEMQDVWKWRREVPLERLTT